MAISVSCPECGAGYKLADHLAGKKVRCKGCGSIFPAVVATAPLVEEDEEKVRPGPPARTARAQTAEEPKGSSRPPRGRRRPEDDDEDDDVSPRRRRRDDDDDDEPRPRKRRRPKNSGSNTGLLIGVAAAVVILLLFVGGLIFFLSRSSPVAKMGPPKFAPAAQGNP